MAGWNSHDEFSSVFLISESCSFHSFISFYDLNNSFTLFAPQWLNTIINCTPVPANRLMSLGANGTW